MNDYVTMVGKLKKPSSTAKLLEIYLKGEK